MRYKDTNKRVACIFPASIKGNFNIPFGEPLGLLYIAGVANSMGYETEVFIPHQKENLETFIERIVEFSPNILAFSIMTCHAYDAVEILARIKKKRKNLLSVAGGPHPTLEPEFFLRRGFDICVIGQGEIPFRDILRAVSVRDSINGINGISYIRHGKLVITPPPPMVDLDSLPLPLRLPVNLKGPIIGSLGYPNPKISAWASIVTSRGCPYSCFYCCSPIMFNRRIAWRSPEAVVEEMNYLFHTFGVDFFPI